MTGLERLWIRFITNDSDNGYLYPSFSQNLGIPIHYVHGSYVERGIIQLHKFSDGNQVMPIFINVHVMDHRAASGRD
jgi:hypothetical protein